MIKKHLMFVLVTLSLGINAIAQQGGKEASGTGTPPVTKLEPSPNGVLLDTQASPEVQRIIAAITGSLTAASTAPEAHEGSVHLLDDGEETTQQSNQGTCSAEEATGDSGVVKGTRLRAIVADLMKVVFPGGPAALNGRNEQCCEKLISSIATMKEKVEQLKRGLSVITDDAEYVSTLADISGDLIAVQKYINKLVDVCDARLNEAIWPVKELDKKPMNGSKDAREGERRQLQKAAVGAYDTKDILKKNLGRHLRSVECVEIGKNYVFRYVLCILVGIYKNIERETEKRLT